MPGSRLSAHAVAGAALLLLPVAFAAPKQVVTLAAAASLAVLWARLQAPRGERRRFRPHVSILLAALLAVWGAVSALWAPVPGETVLLALRLAAMCAGAALLAEAVRGMSPEDRTPAARALVSGSAAAVLGVAAILLVVGIARLPIVDADIAAHSLIAHFNRGAAALAIVSWPLALAVRRSLGRPAAAATLVVTLLVLAGLQPTAPLVAFVAGGTILGLAWIAPRVAAGLLLAGFLAMILAIPFMEALHGTAGGILQGVTASPESSIHRLLIWQFAADRIAERPVLGWGLDASRILAEGRADVLLLPDRPGSTAAGSVLPLHPHNAVIQVWLELGLPGLLLLSGLFGILLHAAVGAGPGRAAAAVGLATLAAALVVAQLSFGIWQGWWMGTLGLAAVVTMLLTIGSPAVRRAGSSTQTRG